MAKEKSKQPFAFTTFTKILYVGSEEDRNLTIGFLEREAELDKLNYQEMLNVVDMTTLTKAKITALGKLGTQYSKASTALIKKYKKADINETRAEEHPWIKHID